MNTGQRSRLKPLALGSGIHPCLGMRLAKAETATAFQQFFARFPEFDLGSGESDWALLAGTSDPNPQVPITHRVPVFP